MSERRGSRLLRNLWAAAELAAAVLILLWVLDPAGDLLALLWWVTDFPEGR